MNFVNKFCQVVGHQSTEMTEAQDPAQAESTTLISADAAAARPTTPTGRTG